jgi:hypothetical protein
MRKEETSKGCAQRVDTVILSHDTLEAVLEPLDGFGLIDAVRGANAGLASPAFRDTLTWAGPEKVS